MKLNVIKCVYSMFGCVLCLSSGCGLVGLASVMGTESYEESKVPAEFDLTGRRDRTVLALVEQPGYINTNVNMRFYLTRAINSSLYMNVGIADANLPGYDRIAEFRAANPGWSTLSPVEIGSRLGADMVLHVHIEDLQLGESGEAAYLAGKLNTRAALLDVTTGERLWPDSPAGKQVKVGFEIEERGWDVAVSRLAVASAHCTTRYLYDCKKKRFRIPDDRSIVDWENWEE